MIKTSILCIVAILLLFFGGDIKNYYMVFSGLAMSGLFISRTHSHLTYNDFDLF